MRLIFILIRLILCNGIDLYLFLFLYVLTIDLIIICLV